MGALLDAAATGHVRRDVAAWELLWAIATLCAPTRVGNLDLARRMVDLLTDGLRPATA